MISVENIQKSFGGQQLFDGASFKIGPKERIGLVGRNGHGKTTLFRMIMGEIPYDEGAIIIPKNYRIGMVRQTLNFTEGSVLQEGMKDLPADKKHHHWEVEKVLGGLGFTSEDMQRHPQEFSGGFQIRLNLAKAIVAEPDLLLLDEPTNYLDITSIRWVETFLVKWPHEIMLITHDRSFMDKVVTHVVGIHRKKVRKIPGDTQKYYSQIVQDEEIYEKTRQNDERRQKEIQQFITRFRAKARLANLVQSRIKSIQKMEKKDKLEELKTLSFSFRNKPFRGKQVLRAENLSFAYDPQIPLIEDLSFTVNTGDRICIVGKNGKGKTTLLKILAEKLHPDKGKLAYNPNVDFGFFEQTNIQTLNAARTVAEEIGYVSADISIQEARDICGAMMFEGDAALKKIAVLSGGEKSRVLLGKILAVPANLLLLDEPTNHLDMDSCDALLTALNNFSGTIIIVTHNEMFLHALADRLLVFQSGGVTMFEGGYQQFLDKEGWREEQKDNLSIQDYNSGLQTNRLSKKDNRKMRSEVIIEKSQVLKPLEKSIATTEADIAACEEKLNRFNHDLVKASRLKNGDQIAMLSKDIHKYQLQVDALFGQLEKLYDDKDQTELYYEKRLKDLQSSV